MSFSCKFTRKGWNQFFFSWEKNGNRFFLCDDKLIHFPVPVSVPVSLAKRMTWIPPYTKISPHPSQFWELNSECTRIRTNKSVSTNLVWTGKKGWVLQKTRQKRPHQRALNYVVFSFHFSACWRLHPHSGRNIQSSS